VNILDVAIVVQAYRMWWTRKGRMIPPRVPA